MVSSDFTEYNSSNFPTTVAGFLWQYYCCNVVVKILVEGQRVEQVTQFKYLGSIISSSGYCEDIRSRIVMGKQAFGNKKRLLTGNMNLDFKKKIVKCSIWSVVLYGAETWTMTQADKERLEAFEMWIWMEENVKDQLGRQSIKCRSTADSTRKQQHLRHCTSS